MQVEAWLARAARLRPGWTALEALDGRCTYSELDARACACARALRAAGVCAGDRVAIVLPPSLDFAYALHACLLLGAAAVPIDVRLGPAERALQCEGAAFVVAQPLAEGSAVTPLTQQVGPAADEPLLHDLDAVAAVIHTSGTTAAARPIELTYGNFLWSALGSAAALDLDRRERWLCALPVAHVGGLSILIRSAIYATTAVLHPRFETDLALRALGDGDVTLVSLVATTLARLLDAGLRDPASLRCALTGGGPVPAELVARARACGVPVRLTYGMTEACSQITTAPIALGRESEQSFEGARTHARARVCADDSNNGVGEDTRLDPIEHTSAHAGPPLFCTRVGIADDGEILVAGPTVAPGSLAPDGWLHTGDLGELDQCGFLHVTGRKADTIISGGENVAPAEIEAVLEAHPDVLEAAVLARAHPRWGEAVTALVVKRPGSAARPEALRAHCATRLAPYKVPKWIELVAEPLPRTRSGKLLRRELR
jgi:O-succinylbenzoic acid--CoA ligase